MTTSSHTYAMRVHETGAPDVLRWEEIDLPELCEGEVLVRNTAVGLNFLDVYHRTGRYPSKLPFVAGHEGAGVVEIVGPGVTEFAVGDRVGYVGPMGAYAELTVRPAARLVKVPESISDQKAAGMLLKGMTAEYLVRRTYAVKRGETILIHAASGGVGQILCQWASAIGARVIGTVGSADKSEIASRVGCEHVIVIGRDDLVTRVRELTNGKGVAVAYDGVGGELFLPTLDCIAPRGLMASFGAAAGPPPPIEVQLLAVKGSLYLTRPGLVSYTATTAELRQSAAALFDMVFSGDVSVEVSQTYALRDAALAHADLEARKLTGSTVLLP